MSEEKKPSDASFGGTEGRDRRSSFPKRPPALPLGPDGKPLQPQIDPEGKIIKGPPLGPDGKPVSPPLGPDGKPLPPPPILGPDGQEFPRPTDAKGNPLPIYVTPEGKPILNDDGKPIPLKFDQEGKPLPLELPSPAGAKQAAKPEDNLAKASLWAGSIDLFLRAVQIITIGCIIGTSTSQNSDPYFVCGHQYTYYIAGAGLLMDVLPFVAWKKKMTGVLSAWIIVNWLIFIGGCVVVNFIQTSTNTNCFPFLTAADLTVIIQAATCAFCSSLVLVCLKCDCQCGDDGTISRGNYGGGYNNNSLYPRNMNTNAPGQMGGFSQLQQQQQQQIIRAGGQGQQNQVVQGRQGGGGTTTVITTMTPMMNPMMMGMGYGYGGYPFYGGGFGGYGGYYSPYYDYWGYDDWW